MRTLEMETVRSKMQRKMHNLWSNTKWCKYCKNMIFYYLLVIFRSFNVTFRPLKHFYDKQSIFEE